MALMECPECGSEASSKAPACPHCGNPLNPARSAYLTAIAATIAADDVVGAGEIRRLYGVHALLDTGDAERLDLLRHIVLEPERLADFELPEEILEDEELRMALAKDALFIGETQESNATRAAVQRLLTQIRLAPEQLKVMEDWVSWENGLLRQMGAGDEHMANPHDPRELVSRAAAVGVPLGALYVVGTTGFGAVGLSTGLATIGTVTGLTVLGLNPMTAGIAGLIIAGITVKKVSDYAMRHSGGETKESRKHLEEFRRVQLGAATRLAGDIPRVEALIIAQPDERWTRVPGEMRAALKEIENSAK
jgi:hypothetical protein